MSKLPKISGIYKITSPSNKVYIGQSVNLYERLKSYFEPKSAPNQKILKYSLNKYGINAHKIEILEECDVDMLNQRERFYQDEYITNSLNCRLTESKDKSGYCKKITKINISKALKSTDSSWRHLKKTVYQYDKEGNFISEYDSVANAARTIGVNRASIVKAIKGITNKTCKGFYWSYTKKHV